jgi:hypothetical protein
LLAVEQVMDLALLLAQELLVTVAVVQLEPQEQPTQVVAVVVATVTVATAALV